MVTKPSLPELLTLLRYDIADTLSDHRLPCAARVARTASTREEWADVLGDASHVTPQVTDVMQACTALVDGHVEIAVDVMARASSMSVDDWAAAVREEIALTEPAPDAPRTEPSELVPVPPSGEMAAQQVNNLGAQLATIIDRAVKACPAPIGERAKRYQGLDRCNIRVEQRYVANSIRTLERLVRMLYQANDFAAHHDARAQRLSTPVGRPS